MLPRRFCPYGSSLCYDLRKHVFAVQAPEHTYTHDRQQMRTHPAVVVCAQVVRSSFIMVQTGAMLPRRCRLRKHVFAVVCGSILFGIPLFQASAGSASPVHGAWLYLGRRSIVGERRHDCGISPFQRAFVRALRQTTLAKATNTSPLKRAKSRDRLPCPGQPVRVSTAKPAEAC